jgi:hypothetical protein
VKEVKEEASFGLYRFVITATHCRTLVDAASHPATDVLTVIRN